jgi:hypothetical protein
MVAFLGQDPLRCTIVVDNKRWQVKNSKYLSCEISYENESGSIWQHLAKFAQTTGILNDTNFQALPILLDGSKIWILEKRIKNNWHQLRWHFSEQSLGNTLHDHKRNEEILEDTKVEWVDEKLRRYKSNWLQHVTRMNNNRMPKIILKYRPHGWRWLGRPYKTLLERPKQVNQGLTCDREWWWCFTWLWNLVYYSKGVTLAKVFRKSVLGMASDPTKEKITGGRT